MCHARRPGAKGLRCLRCGRLPPDRPPGRGRVWCRSAMAHGPIRLRQRAARWSAPRLVQRSVRWTVPLPRASLNPPLDLSRHARCHPRRTVPLLPRRQPGSGRWSATSARLSCVSRPDGARRQARDAPIESKPNAARKTVTIARDHHSSSQAMSLLPRSISSRARASRLSTGSLMSTTISTRRFSARPSAVLLSARGLVSA